jgi:hypothetical protein
LQNPIMISEATRRELEQELFALQGEEELINNELRDYFASIGNGGVPSSSGGGFNSANLIANVDKVEKFAPQYETMMENSKKLAAQVSECRQLSDKMSIMVRRLDLKQIRAQQALACTEDIINLKECKVRMTAAMEEGNLPLAVSFIKQVHDIDEEAAKASDDFFALQQTEQELRELVLREYNKAIEDSNIDTVVSMCPLFQTMSLETEARDTFLNFIEKTVFIAVSADAASVEGATDPSTAYAQSLSSVFNSAFLIFQQYLPMVIQGMESSLGDVYFIRRLHAKTEKEAGVVLKRYLKFRNVNDVMSSLKVGAAGKVITSAADLHVILDEIALLIQYCCMYGKYLKQLCVGAEEKVRTNVSSSALPSSGVTAVSASSKALSKGGGMSSVSQDSDSSALHANTGSAPLGGATDAIMVTVFTGPTEFSQMVDELVNRYYMEGEKWLMREGVRSAIPPVGSAGLLEGGNGLDECFFVLRRCAQRALATNNMLAASPLLQAICEMLTSDLLGQVSEVLSTAAAKVHSVLQEHMAKYIEVAQSDGVGSFVAGVDLTKGLESAMSLAASLSAAGGVPGAGGIAGRDKGAEGDVVSNEIDEDDPWRVAGMMEYFNIAEMCSRYTDRLAKEIYETGMTVFSQEGNADLESLKQSKEDFDTAKMVFTQAVRQGLEAMTQLAGSTMKDLLARTLGRGGALGGIKFELPDEKFEAQPALALLPKALVLPFETVVSICTSNMSDVNKDVVVGMLTDACTERLEHFIAQNQFRFSGALKFEECVRALSGMFGRASSSSSLIRSKFSRLREIMIVLTSDNADLLQTTDTFTHLTSSEVSAFASLRIDAHQGNV